MLLALRWSRTVIVFGLVSNVADCVDDEICVSICTNERHFANPRQMVSLGTKVCSTVRSCSPVQLCVIAVQSVGGPMLHTAIGLTAIFHHTMFQ